MLSARELYHLCKSLAVWCRTRKTIILANVFFVCVCVYSAVGFKFLCNIKDHVLLIFV
jgi:hypothetical protein